MKLRARAYLSAALSIVLVFVLGLLLSLSRARVRDIRESAAFVDSVVEVVFDLSILTSEYASTRSKSAEFRWQSKLKELGSMIRAKKFDDARQAALWAKVEKNHGASQEVFEQKKGGTDSEGRQSILSDQLSFRSQTIVANAVALKQVIREDLGKVERQSERMSWFFIGLLILVSAIGTVITVTTVVVPVAKLHKGVEIIGKGDLDYQVDITSTDEIGALAEAFNQMAKDLKKITASRDDLNTEVAERKRAEERILKLNQDLTRRGTRSRES